MPHGGYPYIRITEKVMGGAEDLVNVKGVQMIGDVRMFEKCCLRHTKSPALTIFSGFYLLILICVSDSQNQQQYGTIINNITVFFLSL